MTDTLTSNSLRMTEGGLDDDRVIALLHVHVARARAESPPGSSHALDLDGLRAANVRFWTLWQDDILAGFGALKRLSADHSEVKSMHTAETVRGRGAGKVMLRHIITTARAEGMTRLSLETGTWDYFAPARALYAAHGFVECAAFGDYRPDPNSLFLTLDLTA